MRSYGKLSVAIAPAAARYAASPCPGALPKRAHSPAPYVLVDSALASDLPRQQRTIDGGEGLDYDPWVSFNHLTFSFNFDLPDRYALKPAAEEVIIMSA